MRLTLKNEEADIIIGIGQAGGNANAGGRVGFYELKPGEECPVEIEPGTTVTFTARKVDPAPAPSSEG